MDDISEKFGSMQTSLTGQFETIFALTAAAQPVQLAVMFGVNMVFRFLKFGSRLRKVYEAEQRQFDESVRAQGVVLLPVDIRPTTTLVETFFFRGMAASTFPEEYAEMKDQIKLYQEGSFTDRKSAIKKLEVAYFIMNKGNDWRHNEALMELANASLKPGKVASFREAVDALEPLYGNEFIGFADFDGLLEEYATQELAALRMDMDQLQSQHVSELRSTVKEMFWDTMLFGDDDTVQQTLSFIVAQKLLAQQQRRERVVLEIAQCEDPQELPVLQKRMEEIEAEIATLSEYQG